MGAFFAHVPFFSRLFIFLVIFETSRYFVVSESESESGSDETGLTEKDEDNSFGGTWITEKSQVEFSVFRTRDVNAPFEVDLQVFGKKHHLKLRRPESSIFGNGFKMDGREMRSDELEKVEQDIFVDNDAKAVLQIYESSNATFCLRGWLHGVGIVARGDCQMEAIRISESSDGIESPKYGPEETQSSQQKHRTSSRFSDSESSNKELRQDNNNEMGYIEIMVLFDKEASGAIKKNKFTIEKYAAILIKAVNTIWASMSNPKIQFILVGARSLNSTEDKKLIKNGNGDIHKILKLVNKFQKDKGEKNLVPSDVLALVSGRGLSGTAGLANKNSACTKKGIAVARDTGGAFEGVKTFAHECGHTMGCVHDFQVTDDRPDCFTTKGDENGYVMNYFGKTPNMYKFSPCSKEMIRDYVKDGGGCIYNRTTTKEIKLDNVKFPGQETTLTQQCIANLNKKVGAKDIIQPYPVDYAEDCLVIKCTYLASKNNKNKTLNFHASQGTKCVNKVIPGVCKDKKCVAGGSSGSTATTAINDQCKDKIQEKFKGEYTAVPDDDAKYVTCEEKSYKCKMEDKNKKRVNYDFTPKDGTPCAYKNSYGICYTGTCQCSPKCSQ